MIPGARTPTAAPPGENADWHTPHQIRHGFEDAAEVQTGMSFVITLLFLMRSTVVMPHHRKATGQAHHRLGNRIHHRKGVHIVLHKPVEHFIKRFFAFSIN